MVGWRIALWAVIVLAALCFFYLVRGILLPFLLALLLSALLDPLVRKLRLRGLSRAAAVWTVMLSFVVLTIGLAVAVAPTVTRQLGSLRDKVDQYAFQLTTNSGEDNFFLKWNPRVAVRAPGTTNEIDRLFQQNREMLQRLNLPLTRQSAISQYVEPHRNDIAKAVETFFGGLLGFLSGFGSKALLLLFTPIFTLLILLDLERFQQRLAMLIPPSIRRDTIGLLSDIGEVFGKYLRGVATVLIYYVVVAGILLTILGAPYAILLAIVFSLIYLIPYIGPVVIAGLLILITGLSQKTGNIFFSMPNVWSFAATITLVYYVAMTVFDQLVYTRIVGKSVGLHPVVSFFVVFSGAALFGPIGMILAFPVAGSVKVILDRLFRITSNDQDGLDLPSVPMRHRASVQA
jgi:predicted PurR-regulated permease PerM